jgi:hypothetical protein
VCLVFMMVCVGKTEQTGKCLGFKQRQLLSIGYQFPFGLGGGGGRS